MSKNTSVAELIGKLKAVDLRARTEAAQGIHDLAGARAQSFLAAVMADSELR